MRYKLRTLMIVLALGPMVLAGAWFAYLRIDRAIQARLARRPYPIAPTGFGLIDARKIPATEYSILMSIPADEVNATAPPASTTPSDPR
jgi:hypothetical protein